MNPLKIIIVDDEKKLRTSMRHLLEMYYPNSSVVSEAGDIEAAYSEIKKHQPDVVLLDIKMPGGSGFELIKKLSPINFKLIFVTAFDQYAVQAFKFSALDYLLKPVNPDELVSALQKAKEQIGEKEIATKLEVFMSNVSSLTRETKKIILKTQDTVHILPLTDIIRCEADRNYTRFILIGGKSIMVSGSLIEYDDMLNSVGFFRSHHSHLINLSHILRFEKSNMQLVMKDNSLIPLATRKKDILMELLENI